MVEITAVSDRIELSVLGWSRLWAFKRRVMIPVSAIAGVSSAPLELARGIWKTLRIPGTYFPGVIVAGSYYAAGKWSFWDVRKLRNAIVLELDGSQAYDRLVVEVEDPAVALKTIETAMKTTDRNKKGTAGGLRR